MSLKEKVHEIICIEPGHQTSIDSCTSIVEVKSCALPLGKSCTFAHANLFSTNVIVTSPYHQMLDTEYMENIIYVVM